LRRHLSYTAPVEGWNRARRVWQASVAMVVQAPEDSEAQLRFRFYSFFGLLSGPYMLGFGVADLLRGEFLLSGLVFASLGGMFIGWLLLRAGRHALTVYRANALVFALLILYLIAVGGDGGSRSLWIYVYPLVLVFVLGVNEGAIWVGALLVSAVGLMWSGLPGLTVYAYPQGFKIRLVGMYAAISLATMAFEHSRRLYRDAMWREREKKAALIRELQASLAQVKTLKGLVPICANCHRIRDDQGFWNQLEGYLREHSDADFSHGICPACVKAFFPEFDDAAPAG
jgi:hypothetical protein